MNFLDYAIIITYLIGLIAMGLAFRDQANKDDYFLGGRSLGWGALSLSVMATQLSAISFISAPAFVGLRPDGGLKWLSYELAVPLAMLVLMTWVLPPLYRSGVVSIYDFLEKRFDRSSRVLLSLVFQVSRSFATAIMIYAVSIILQGTMGLEFAHAIALIGGVTVIYSLMGGMKAVVYGDALQMLIIILGTFACIGFGLFYLGGIDVFARELDASRLQAIDFTSFGFSGDGFGFWPMLFGGIVLYASYYGCDQTQAQRSLSAKNEQSLKNILIANGVLRFPITILYCAAGLVIGTLATTTPEFLNKIPDSNPDWMIPIFIVEYLPNGMIGLLVVAILAAAMSSLSSAINSLSAVSVEDYCRISGQQLSDRSYLNAARMTAIGWGIATIGLSFFAGSIAPTVIEAINLVGSLFFGPILAIFLLAFLSKRTGAMAANIGLLSGVAVNLLVWAFLPNVFWFWYNVIGLLVTIALSYLCVLVFGRKSPRDDPELALVDTASITTRRDVVILVGAFAFILTFSIMIGLIWG